MQLRDDKVEFMWIDAICINQDDLAERSEQVSKMRTIYEGPEEVLVWLGSSIGGASLAFDPWRTCINPETRGKTLRASSGIEAKSRVSKGSKVS